MEPDSPPAENPPTPTSNPVMDVVPPPVEKAPASDGPANSDDKPQDSKKEQAKKTSPKAPKKPKQPNNGVGLAIFATIIIVLGLGALATYAYLKTR